MLHYTADEIDLLPLAEMVGNDLESVQELVEIFLVDTPLLLAAMKTNLTKQDSSALIRHAHTLQSSSRLFQMEQFAGQCQALEQAAISKNWEQITQLVQQLHQDYQAIAATLIAKLSQLQ